MRDALALLDQQHVDEARERIAQQREVSLPVFRRVRQRAHLVERERERRAIALLRGQPKVAQDFLAADARRRLLGHPRRMLSRRRARKLQPASPRITLKDARASAKERSSWARSSSVRRSIPPLDARMWFAERQKKK